MQQQSKKDIIDDFDKDNGQNIDNDCMDLDDDYNDDGVNGDDHINDEENF